MAASPDDSIMHTKKPKEEPADEEWDVEQRDPVQSRQSGILNVVVSGLALFSDGYNAEISPFPSFSRG
jgi:hypothetical protein